MFIFFDLFDWIIFWCTVLAFAGFGAFRWGKKLPAPGNMAVRVISLCGLALSILGLCFGGLGRLMIEPSGYLISPDGKHAVVVSEFTTLTDRTTNVTLYSDHGLKSEFIYQGLWVFTSKEDIHWVNNSKLVIGYRGSSVKSAPRICSGAAGVEVVCEQIGALGHRNGKTL